MFQFGDESSKREEIFHFIGPENSAQLATFAQLDLMKKNYDVKQNKPS